MEDRAGQDRARNDLDTSPVSVYLPFLFYFLKQQRSRTHKARCSCIGSCSCFQVSVPHDGQTAAWLPVFAGSEKQEKVMVKPQHMTGKVDTQRRGGNS